MAFQAPFDRLAIAAFCEALCVERANIEGLSSEQFEAIANELDARAKETNDALDIVCVELADMVVVEPHTEVRARCAGWFGRHVEAGLPGTAAAERLRAGIEAEIELARATARRIRLSRSTS